MKILLTFFVLFFSSSVVANEFQYNGTIKNITSPITITYSDYSGTLKGYSQNNTSAHGNRHASAINYI